jgi:hypothetical protein
VEKENGGGWSGNRGRRRRGKRKPCALKFETEGEAIRTDVSKIERAIALN